MIGLIAPFPTKFNFPLVCNESASRRSALWGRRPNTSTPGLTTRPRRPPRFLPAFELHGGHPAETCALRRLRSPVGGHRRGRLLPARRGSAQGGPPPGGGQHQARHSRQEWLGFRRPHRHAGVLGLRHGSGGVPCVVHLPAGFYLRPRDPGTGPGAGHSGPAATTTVAGVHRQRSRPVGGAVNGVLAAFWSAAALCEWRPRPTSPSLCREETSQWPRRRAGLRRERGRRTLGCESAEPARCGRWESRAGSQRRRRCRLALNWRMRRTRRECAFIPSKKRVCPS